MKHNFYPQRVGGEYSECCNRPAGAGQRAAGRGQRGTDERYPLRTSYWLATTVYSRDELATSYKLQQDTGYSLPTSYERDS
jgi:hypothetical protein